MSKEWSKLPEGWQTRGIPTTTLTPKELNRIHKEFWKERGKQDRTLLEEAEVALTAFETLTLDAVRGVPVHNQTTLSAALERAAQLRDRFLAGSSPLAELGLRARKNQ